MIVVAILVTTRHICAILAQMMVLKSFALLVGCIVVITVYLGKAEPN